MLMGKVRKRYSREFKVQVLRELASGKSLAQLCREHGISRFLVSRWRREYEENPGGAFAGNGNVCKDAARVAELERLVGELYAENRFLKQALDALKQREAGRRGG
jgi:transposase